MTLLTATIMYLVAMIPTETRTARVTTSSPASVTTNRSSSQTQIIVTSRFALSLSDAPPEEMPAPVKRGPGRPPGSKNKKTLAKEAGVAMPASNKRPRDVWVVESRTENYGRYDEDETLERKDIHGVFASLRAANKEARKITAMEVDGREDSEKIHLSEERDRDDAPFYYCLEEEIDGTTRYVAESCWTIEVRKFPLR